MAFTVCYALLGSMLLALTLIPVLATYLFRNGAKSWENPVLRLAARGAMSSVLRRVVRRPLLVGRHRRRRAWSRPSLWPARWASSSCPNLDEGVIWVRANFPPASRSTSRREMAGADPRPSCATIRRCNWSLRRSGRNDSGTDPYGPNRNEFFVALKPYDTWPAGMDKAELVEESQQQAERPDSRRRVQLHAADHR